VTGAWDGRPGAKLTATFVRCEGPFTQQVSRRTKPETGRLYGGSMNPPASVLGTTATQAAAQAVPLEPGSLPGRKHWIDGWDAEDVKAWEAGNKVIAKRNLVYSILSEHVGFCVWSLWSVFVLFLGPEYGLSPADKFLLTSIPTAVGAAMRLPYTLAVAKFGGRNWTIVSALMLLIPTTFVALTLKPGMTFTTMLIGAALAGVGGGNFSSSMANIDSFYPQRLKGWALGLNAGGGNIGVASTQLVGLAVLAFIGKDHPRFILALYIPLIVVSVIGAATQMDNLSHVRNEKGALRDIARHRHTWAIAVLYIGTFGTFIGFGFAFGQVLQVQFSSTFDTPVKAAYITFLGPLLGSLMRPAGGKLADTHGGARVTLITFLAMIAGTAVIIAASVTEQLALFIVGFIVLFVLTGIGNGSVYKMIPTIFRSEAQGHVASGRSGSEADRTAQRRSRALIGLTGAIGSFGGVLVNMALRQSFLSRGSATAAYVAILLYYVACVVLVSAVYLRAPQTAGSGVSDPKAIIGV
jgi:MFS transporter, NNP family, nitrate/nitrite transporter